MSRFIVYAFLLFTVHSFAQPSDFWSRVRYGGGLGLGFGNDSFNLQLAPSAIYEVNPYFATGVGLQLNYAQLGDFQFLGYGGSALWLFNPIDQIQFSTELEQWRINREETFAGTRFEEKYWLTSLFFGIGYRANSVTFGFRYDVLFNENRSLNVDPWVPFIRFYF